MTNKTNKTNKTNGVDVNLAAMLTAEKAKVETKTTTLAKAPTIKTVAVIEATVGAEKFYFKKCDKADLTNIGKLLELSTDDRKCEDYIYWMSTIALNPDSKLSGTKREKIEAMLKANADKISFAKVKIDEKLYNNNRKVVAQKLTKLEK